MATHLSARLAWHDRSWDGRICDQPHLNSSCIVLEHIRDSRKDVEERKSAGQTFDQLKGWLPPCSRDASAYSPHKGFEVHRDPLDFRALPSVSEEIPPYSCCPSPYRWLREENFRSVCEAENLTIRGPDKPREVSWIMEPHRQRELLKHFWEKFEPKKSLIFYYCNQGNPLDENTSRIVVGVGRIAKVGPQLYFGTKPRYEDQYPIWARCVTQDYPDQASDTRLRNTQMFKLALRPTEFTKPHLEALIHRTRKGVAVRSKSEVIVADTLDSLGISYEYEKVLVSRSDPRDFRLPDFTVGFEGDIFYWEHLGVLTVPSYRESWERKKKWYEAQGYAGQLITSEDGPDGSIDAAQIEAIARKRILQE